MRPVLAILLVACVGFPADLAWADAEVGAMVRTSRMQGSASVDRRTPVVGATVLVRPAADASRLFLTATAERGAFRVDGLVDGEYRLRLDREGFDTVVKTGVALKYPFRAVVELTMQPRAEARPAAADASGVTASEAALSLFGRVTHVDSGMGQAEVLVRAVRADGGQDPELARSDETGSFRLDGLAPGDWRLEVIGAGFLAMRTRIELVADTEAVVRIVDQPAQYEPTPLELMPPEIPIPPEALRQFGG